MILDGRTREARRQEILRQIREHGGFSIFWITHRRRAKLATEMVERGEIIVTPREYPWSDAEIAKGGTQ